MEDVAEAEAEAEAEEEAEEEEGEEDVVADADADVDEASLPTAVAVIVMVLPNEADPLTVQHHTIREVEVNLVLLLAMKLTLAIWILQLLMMTLRKFSKKLAKSKRPLLITTRMESHSEQRLLSFNIGH